MNGTPSCAPAPSSGSLGPFWMVLKGRHVCLLDHSLFQAHRFHRWTSTRCAGLRLYLLLCQPFGRQQVSSAHDLALRAIQDKESHPSHTGKAHGLFCAVGSATHLALDGASSFRAAADLMTLCPPSPMLPGPGPSNHAPSLSLQHHSLPATQWHLSHFLGTLSPYDLPVLISLRVRMLRLMKFVPS